MKRTIIGSVLLLSGTLISLSLIIIATFYVFKINEYRGTKIWFIIFGARDLGRSAQSLNIGIPFVVGLILFGLGFLILLIEYFKKDQTGIKKTEEKIYGRDY